MVYKCWILFKQYLSHELPYNCWRIADTEFKTNSLLLGSPKECVWNSVKNCLQSYKKKMQCNGPRTKWCTTISWSKHFSGYLEIIGWLDLYCWTSCLKILQWYGDVTIFRIKGCNIDALARCLWSLSREESLRPDDWLIG